MNTSSNRFETRLVKETPDSVVFVGKKAYLGLKKEFETKDTLTGLISKDSVLIPSIVRAVDTNKYEPHQSFKERNRRVRQHSAHA